jgi:hypothetical protein
MVIQRGLFPRLRGISEAEAEDMTSPKVPLKEEGRLRIKSGNVSFRV